MSLERLSSAIPPSTEISVPAISLPTRSVVRFDVADIAFAKILSEVDIEAEIDGREMSIAQIDFLFNATSLIEDTPTGYVEHLDEFDLYNVDHPVPPLWTGDIDIV